MSLTTPPSVQNDKRRLGDVKARGLVICELRTGELVICELIVRTTDANLGYNANHKVRTFMQLKDANIRACVYEMQK